MSPQSNSSNSTASSVLSADLHAQNLVNGSLEADLDASLVESQLGARRTVSKPLDEKLSELHLNILTGKQLITVFLGMSMLIFFLFTDQTGITVALPDIAASLDAERSISWARHR